MGEKITAGVPTFDTGETEPINSQEEEARLRALQEAGVRIATTWTRRQADAGPRQQEARDE